MYEFFEAIFWPLKWIVEAILVTWHNVFIAFGMDANDGLTWVLAIIGVVLVVRCLTIPLTVRQIKSQRKMLELSPEMRKIQAKYKGKRDQYSREAMQREIMAMYKKHGTNPLASCMPLLVQMPIFFSLYFVLSNAARNSPGVGLMNSEPTESFNNAIFLNAPLKMNFSEGLGSGNTIVAVMLGVIMVAMILSQFFTQKQIISKNISDETKNSPMYRQQQMLMYILPLGFLFSGFLFPLALNIYWLVSNLWTMGQQAIVINTMPTPGSEAWRKRQERLRRRGKLVETENEADNTTDVENKGQRQQPMSAKRAKKQGGKK